MDIPAETKETCTSGGDATRAAALPAWAIRVASAAAGAVGLTGLLYAAGFVATRSHQTFWGLWDGAAEDAGGMVSEGGRFFYHLAFVLVDLLSPLSSGAGAGFYILLIAGLSLCVVPGASLQRFLTRRTGLARTLRIGVPLVLALATYAWGLLLLRDLGDVLKPSALLTFEGAAVPYLVRFVCQPADIYFTRVTDWIALGVLFAAGVWALRLNDNLVIRTITWLGGCFFLAAASLLPAAYGRLVLQPDYARIEFARDEGKPVARVLIRAAGSQWVVWNLTARKTEVISLGPSESVTIGSRRLLSIPAFESSRGDICGQR